MSRAARSTSLAAARQLVEARAPDLDRRDHRRRLALGPGERGGRGRDVGVGDVGHGRARDRRAVGVEAVGRDAQARGPDVALGPGLGVAQQARGRADGDDEEPGRHRVEGPRVAGAPHRQGAAHRGDRVVAGRAAPLVDQQQAARAAHGPGGAGSPRPSRRAATAGSAAKASRGVRFMRVWAFTSAWSSTRRSAQRLGALVGQRVEVHGRGAQVRRGLDPGHRDQAQALVLVAQAHQGLGDDLAQDLVDARGARVGVVATRERAMA